MVLGTMVITHDRGNMDVKHLALHQPETLSETSTDTAAQRSRKNMTVQWMVLCCDFKDQMEEAYEQH